MTELTLSQIRAIFGNMFKRKWAYRFDYFGWTSISVVVFLAQYFLWKALFAASGQEVIRGFTFNSMMLYYFLAHIIANVTSANFDEWMAHLVHDGRWTIYFSRPVATMKYIFIEQIAGRIANLSFSIPMLTVAALFLVRSFQFNLVNFLLFFASLVLAFILAFCYIFLFGCASFWLRQYFGMQHIRHGITSFLNGSLIPLTFFPPLALKIFSFLPFQYFNYIPIQLYLGNIPRPEIAMHFGMQVMWIAVFYCLASWAWRKAMFRYSEAGA